MLEDIRNINPEEHWETLRRRWGALLSYRYIGRQFSSMNTVADDIVTLRHDMRNAAGGILAQVLSICALGGERTSALTVRRVARIVAGSVAGSRGREGGRHPSAVPAPAVPDPTTAGRRRPRVPVQGPRAPRRKERV